MAKVEPQEQNAVARYLREVRSELSKVVWPSQEQVINLTIVVLVVVVGMSVFFGISDLFFGEVVQTILRVLG